VVSLDKELEAAKAAKGAMNALLTRTTPKSVVSATLRSANTAAVVNLGKGGALNEARASVGIALSNLMHGSPTPERIAKAMAAIDAWIKELERSQ
jgi:hypothetical protein